MRVRVHTAWQTIRDPKLVIYPFGNTNDPQNFFADQQENRPNAKYGYLQEGALGRIPYIQGVVF